MHQGSRSCGALFRGRNFFKKRIPGGKRVKSRLKTAQHAVKDDANYVEEIRTQEKFLRGYLHRYATICKPRLHVARRTVQKILQLPRGKRRNKRDWYP